MHFNLHNCIFANGAFDAFKQGECDRDLIGGREVIGGKTLILTPSPQPSNLVFLPCNLLIFSLRLPASKSCCLIHSFASSLANAKCLLYSRYSSRYRGLSTEHPWAPAL